MLEKLANFFSNQDSKFSRNQKQFVEHWLCVANYLHSDQGKSGDVYDTPASEHIAEMIYMIEKDVAAPGSDYGPCVEYILENEVLGTLEQHARADAPQGMRRLVLNFFSQLLQKLQMSALPHVNISKPFREMVNICGGGRHPIDEIHFISSILGKFHQDTSLVNLFLSETESKGKGPIYEFRLIDALLSLSHSEDERVAMRSCEGLLLCCSLDSGSVMDLIMSCTIIVMDLVSRLCQRYTDIRDNDVLYINNSNVTWNSQVEQYLWEGYEKRIIKLLGWLDYINTLTTTSHIKLSSTLLEHINKSFFITHLLEDLQSSGTTTVIKALVMIQKMVRTITSQLFLVELLKFLTEDDTVRQLCALLNSEDIEVVEKTLLVLNEMLCTHHSIVVETLILSYTRNHTHVRPRLIHQQDTPVLKRTISSDSGVDDMLSDEESSVIQYCPKPATGDDVTTLVTIASEYQDSSRTSVQRLETPGTSSEYSEEKSDELKVCIVPHLADSVEAFLNIMPEYTQRRLTGYSEYLHDAHLQVQSNKADWTWMNYLLPDSEVLEDEGVLLRALILMTESIPYQTYAVNLLLMSVISEICYIPHPSVTIYLLDTSLPPPTLYTQLQDVAVTFSEILAASPTLENELKNVSQDRCLDVCKAVYLSEEFCKELAAISLVKSTTC